MSTETLDNLLEGDSTPAAAPTPEPVSTPAPEAAAKPEPTGDPKSAAPPADAPREQDERSQVPRKALEDERRKRQELERRFKELEEHVAAQRKPQPEAQPPNWDLEPAAAARALEQQFAVRDYQTRVYMSERMLRREHEDYDEVARVFAEAASQNPALVQEVMAHPFPAEFAYDYGRRYKLLSEIGTDPDAYRSRIEADILAKHGITTGGTSAQSAPAPKSKQPAAPVPRSLARDVSQQPRNSRGQFEGPASLDELLG